MPYPVTYSWREHAAPRGWYYEPADPSVGIMTGGWVHEDCPLPDTTDQEVTETEVGCDGERVYYEIRCSCGAVMGADDTPETGS